MSYTVYILSPVMNVFPEFTDLWHMFKLGLRLIICLKNYCIIYLNLIDERVPFSTVKKVVQHYFTTSISLRYLRRCIIHHLCIRKSLFYKTCIGKTKLPPIERNWGYANRCPHSVTTEGIGHSDNHINRDTGKYLGKFISQ